LARELFVKSAFTLALIALSLGLAPAQSKSLEQRIKEFEASNPMPDPAPVPFTGLSEIGTWTSACVSHQEAFNRWELLRLDYLVKGRNVFYRKVAERAFADQLAMTNTPTATCSCLALKRAQALQVMDSKEADALIDGQYQSCRRVGS
jgi:hypothetical protein